MTQTTMSPTETVEQVSCRPKFVCLTNIPTPYRLHFFEVLSQELTDHGWDFEVIFMAESEPGRYWKFKQSDFKFAYRILPGVAPKLSRTVLHCNPQIVSIIAKSLPNVVMMAGAWFLPTNLMAAMQCKFSRRGTRMLFWSESHMNSRSHTGRLMNLLRRHLLNLHDGFVVPGAMAAEYVNTYVPGAKLFLLPNTVDHRVFRDRVLKLRTTRDQLRAEMNIAADARLVMTPARLRPEKGLLPFLTNIAETKSLRRWTLSIAGDGPLRQEIERWCASHPQHDIRLLGQISEVEMVRLYAAADVFLLPSVRDPNPLSVVEALWAELPVLLSTSVGNHHETVMHGQNGWVFDPKDSSSARDAFTEMLRTTDEQLRGFAFRSSRKAQNFETRSVVTRFLDDVLGAPTGS